MGEKEQGQSAESGTNAELHLLLNSFIKSLNAFKTSLDKYAEAIHEDPHPPKSAEINVNPAPGITSYYDSEQQGRPSTRWWKRIERGLAVLTLFSAVTLAWLTYRTLQQVRRQADYALEETRRSHPARLRATNLEINRTELRPGTDLKGVVAIVNTGREEAQIKISERGDVMCRAYWTSELLPMHRPYLVGERNIESHREWMQETEPKPGDSCNGSEGTEKLYPTLGGHGCFSSNKLCMEPGDASEFRFATKVPPDYSPKMSLYVIGLIRYSDPVTRNRFMLFARRYDPAERRFVEVKNSDYEGQDEEPYSTLPEMNSPGER